MRRAGVQDAAQSKGQVPESKVASKKATTPPLVETRKYSPPLFTPTRLPLGLELYRSIMLREGPGTTEGIQNCIQSVKPGEMKSPWLPVRETTPMRTILKFMETKPCIGNRVLTDFAGFIRITVQLENDSIVYFVETKGVQPSRLTQVVSNYKKPNYIKVAGIPNVLNLIRAHWVQILDGFEITKGGDVQVTPDHYYVVPDVVDWVTIMLAPITVGVLSLRRLTCFLNRWNIDPSTRVIVDFTSAVFLSPPETQGDIARVKIEFYSYFEDLSKLESLQKFYTLTTETWYLHPLIYKYLEAINCLNDDLREAVDTNRSSPPKDKVKNPKKSKRKNVKFLLDGLQQKNSFQRRNYRLFLDYMPEDFVTGLYEFLITSKGEKGTPKVAEEEGPDYSEPPLPDGLINYLEFMMEGLPESDSEPEVAEPTLES